MKHYFVKLTLNLGEYEKTAKHVVRAEDEQAAGKLALEHECHNDPEFDDDDFDCCQDGDFHYEVDSIKELDSYEYQLLNSINY